MRLAALFLAMAGCSAQSFEVASVKVNPSGEPGGSTRSLPSGRFEATNSTLQSLIRYAYNVKDYQIAGAPNWLPSDRYDIVAKAPGKADTPAFRVMMQKLLEDRFRLTLAREKRDGPAYSLVIAKGGPKLKESTAPDTTIGSGPGQITGQKMTLAMLANQLAARLDRPVIDNTALPARYDIKLEWTPDDQPADAGGASIFAALQDQLGLRLIATKAPIEMLVITHVERVPTGN